MLVFLYKQRIEQIWDGWLTVSTHSTLDWFYHVITVHHVDLQRECPQCSAAQRSYHCYCSLSSCVVSASELLCAVIVTCCIAKLTQGGLLYGGDRPGRCGKPRKHGTDHCHSEGLDCGYNRLQQRSPSWWEDFLHGQRTYRIVFHFCPVLDLHYRFKNDRETLGLHSNNRTAILFSVTGKQDVILRHVAFLCILPRVPLSEGSCNPLFWSVHPTTWAPEWGRIKYSQITDNGHCMR